MYLSIFLEFLAKKLQIYNCLQLVLLIYLHVHVPLSTHAGMMFSWSIRKSHTPDMFTLLVLAASLMSAVPEHGISQDALLIPVT